jgi:hypothetical protein
VGAKLSIHDEGMDDIFVKPVNRDVLIKPDNRDCGEWICVRGHRIRRRGRMRVDANNDVYITDSEDEEDGMEIEACSVNVADLGGASVAPNGIVVGGDKVMVDGVDVATEGIPVGAVNVAAEEGDGVKVKEDVGTREEMHPNVVARLKMLLDHIDPTFRDVFISMLKIFVLAFFDPLLLDVMN